MKKTIPFIMFFCFLALVIPGPSLFADMSLEGRIDAGVDLVALLPYMTTTSQDDDPNSLSMMPIIPLVDLGFYTQFSAGKFNTGIGLRGASSFYISAFLLSAFWPSLYAEFNIWRFSFNARIGGGALYVFPIVLLTGPYFIPELSMWFNITTFNKADQFKIGIGTIALVYPQTSQHYDNYFQDFSNNIIFYVGVKGTFNYPWKKWEKQEKQEIEPSQ